MKSLRLQTPIAPLHSIIPAIFLAVFTCTLANAAEVQLRILQTTDVHMNLLGYDYYQDKSTDQYGLARAATLIRAARTEAPNSLLFDNGDLLQGSPLGEVMAKVHPLKEGQTHPAYKVMNALTYDAGNIGNHEFNFGLDFLRRSLQGAAFPYVNANVFLAEKDPAQQNTRHAFTPYALLDRQLKDAQGQMHAIKIGVLGLVPPQIMQWDKGHLEGRVTARDMVEMAQRYVPEMRGKGAQLVVVIAHTGFEKGEVGAFAENVASRLAQIAGVDTILLGHAHAEFPGKAFADYPKVDIARGTINGVPAVMPGRWGDHLGVVDLTLDHTNGQWKVLRSQASIRPIFDRTAKKSVAASDPTVEQLIATEHQQTLDYVRGKVAFSSAPIYSYFAQVADDPSVQIVANAQIAYVKRAMQGTAYEKLPVLSAASPFKAGGRQGWSYYTDIPAGPLAMKHVADLYLYPNTLKAVLLTGAELQEWLEMSAGQFRQIDPQGPAQQPLINDAFPSYNFDVIDGVTYAIDVTQPAKYASNGAVAAPQANRIKNLRYQGAPVAHDAQFVVATNNYRAFGGGRFPGINADKVVLDSPDENRQALIEYLTLRDRVSADKAVNPAADGNWRILPIAGVRPTFLSSSVAVKYLGKHPGIHKVRDIDDGSTLFELAD
jgi:2',3'-cyclic-nucleotide 2'-phosphodiesterase/3'-nucleotidase